MFGDSVLVAPVLSADKAQFYLPSGAWTDFFTDEVISGPRWVIKKDYPIDMIPVYVREGTVLLLGPEDVGIPDYAYGEVQLEAICYGLKDGEEVEIVVPKGAGKEIIGKVRVTSSEIVDDAGLSVSLKK